MKFGGELRRDQIKVSFINRPERRLHVRRHLHRQRRGRLPARLPDAVPPGAPATRTWTARRGSYALYAQDEFRLVARHAELRRALRSEPAVRRDAGSPQRVPSRAAVDGVPDRADRSRLSGRCRRAATARTTTDKNNVAPRLVGGVGRERRRPDERSARAWGLFYDTLPGQGDFFQNGTLAPPFQPLTEVNFPLQRVGAAVRESAAGRDRHARLPGRPDLHRLGPGLRDAGGAALQRRRCSSRSATTGASRRATSDRAARTCRSSWRSTRRCRSCRRRRRSVRVCFRRSAWCGRRSPKRESWYDSLQASARMRPWRGINAARVVHAGPRGRPRVRPQHRRRIAADAAGHDRRPGVDRRGAGAREGRRALRRASPLRPQLRLRAAAARRTAARRRGSCSAAGRRTASSRGRPASR